MTNSPPLTPHDHAQQLVESVASARNLNEADTRHRVINTVIHDVLCWPTSAVNCESYIDPGYADYVLLGRRGRQVLFIEAKKAGHYFKLPASFTGKTLYRYVPIKTLLTNKSIAKAINQVRDYCINSGCEHAAVTNGLQWIFFRTFVRDQDWRTIQAFVVEDIRFFDANFTDATNFFSYKAITSNASLSDLFGDSAADHRPRFFPKEKITAYDHEVTSNHLAPFMRPLIERYFGPMNPHDVEFMDRCYVNHREYRVSETNVKQLIHDSLSPYFREYNVKDFFEDKDGGAFGTRISSSARERRTRDVIVLFGGKGSGKSTFTSRILFHRPPNSIKFFTKVAVVNLLECPEEAGRIEEELWDQLIRQLDSEKLLDQPREVLIDLFQDRHDIALKQALAGLNQESAAFNLRLNELIGMWKKDSPYVAEKLSDYWRRRQKGLIIVLDNTDQYSPPNQDFCFTLAHNISTRLDCLVVISMREERFYYSKLHGTLDAFHNSGFHLTSPNPGKLFRLRLKYLLRILDDPIRTRKIATELNAEQIESVKRLARIFFREFLTKGSHLNRFIQACAHGNMRLALDFFRQFALSGYLRVDEMIAEPRWTLQVHQVLRPMMVPYRLFYDERKSSVPNVFQIRSEERGSHFTGLRILDMLSRGSASITPEYIPLSKLRAYFADTFNMLDDAEKTLDVFLRGGVVESNNRIDEYSDTIDSIRVTPYGIYVGEVLAHNFSYLDLVCLDCGVHDQGVADSLAQLGNRDRDLFLDYRKRDRINARVEKVRLFLNYLKREEEIEREIYALDATDRRIMESLRQKYDEDEGRVIRSANRNYGAGKEGDEWDTE